jgi:hypothetical protein
MNMFGYQKHVHQPRIGDNEIKDFLRSKGIDQVNVHYLLKPLKGG